jgi:hypothetical protein
VNSALPKLIASSKFVPVKGGEIIVQDSFQPKFSHMLLFPPVCYFFPLFPPTTTTSGSDSRRPSNSLLSGLATCLSTMIFCQSVASSQAKKLHHPPRCCSHQGCQKDNLTFAKIVPNSSGGGGVTKGKVLSA